MCPAGLLGPGAHRLAEAAERVESPPLDDVIGLSVGNPDGSPRAGGRGSDAGAHAGWRDGITLVATEPHSGEGLTMSMIVTSIVVPSAISSRLAHTTLP